MKITIVSLNFPPKIGGLENVMFGLANEWHKKGHDVTVFTVSQGEFECGFKVIRKLNLFQLLSEVRRSDIFFEANISLKTFWVGLLNKSKWFVTHQLTYTHVQRWQEVIKNRLTKHSKNISASKYIADTLIGKSIVIPNFYSSDFKRLSDIRKEKDIVFVGRLVSDKGADDLIMALKKLKNNKVSFSCSIVGDGPDREKLEQLIKETGLEDIITLYGALRGKDLVAAMNRHKIMVIPSKWPEPFGIVALEGLACGCRIIYSSQGGLPEAANGFGFSYPNNDIDSLAQCIEAALQKGSMNEVEEAEVATYLKERTVNAIADNYLQYFGDNNK